MRATRGVIDLIKIETSACTPIYKQVIESFMGIVREGKVKTGDSVPSINELSFELDISRQTIEKSYRCLKSMDILVSVPKVGYFIKESPLQHQPPRVLLLFNKLGDYKKEIYDAFVASIGERAFIDFFVYNNDLALFKRILQGNAEKYAWFVILPHFIEGDERAAALINTLPKHKLILIDKKVRGIEGNYAAVYENFEHDIYGALQEANERLQKYHTLKIIFPAHGYYPPVILRGFKHFCQDYAFNYEVIDKICKEDIREGEVYIDLTEDDLVTLVEAANELNLTIGEQVGIISYNETPVKKFIGKGITTISTDFRQMGTKAAELLLSNSKEQVELLFTLTLRASL